eukprot:gb/GECH01001733.1/.p1 GENE.gb/GECH01001733.1/~~gb/GECH01001733.1/.p1  ORF type:complete len:439 (+),score=53.13 gb/GECH01001733.1/:1-1317(+)
MSHRNHSPINKPSPWRRDDLWFIEGEAYDLRNFPHPGGPMAVDLGRGRDATVLFHSYHPFTSKPRQVLQKYKVPGIRTQDYIPPSEEMNGWRDSLNHSEFGQDVVRRVRSYFQRKTTTKATYRRWMEISVMSIIVMSLLPWFIHGYYFSVMLFPFFLFILIINTFHDAAHFALSEKWYINAAFTYLYPFFYPPETWYLQHVVSHHTQPNLYGADPDISHIPAVLKMHPIQTRLLWHSLQYIYVLFLWSVMLPLHHLSSAVRILFTDSYMGVVPVITMSMPRKIYLMADRIFWCVMTFAWPFLVPAMPSEWRRQCIFSLVPNLTLSFCLMATISVNHLADHTHKFKETRDWFTHQVRTAFTYAADSQLCFFLTGGLNFQIEHHLFPSVNHCHMFDLHQIVRQCCRDHGIPYLYEETYTGMLKRHLVYLRNNGNSSKLNH